MKLVGTTGATGSINYFKNISVVSDSLSGYTALPQITWGSNSSLIGSTKKAQLSPNQGHIADGNISNFYDITDVVHNNGAITITNVSTDQYGQSYDMKLSFANTDNDGTGKVLIGPASDGSIEFDYYGGFESPVTANSSAGINITRLSFVKHGTNTNVPVFINTITSDLDYNEAYDTSLGNLLTWAPSGSYTSVSGNHVENTAENGQYPNYDGFNSSPKGTDVLVGAGSSFNYYFRSYGRLGAEASNPSHKSTFDNGVQFNLFGRGTSLVQPPTPPTPSSTPAPTRKTSSINFHYDTKSVKILMPEVLIYGHFRHYLHVL